MNFFHYLFLLLPILNCLWLVFFTKSIDDNESSFYICKFFAIIFAIFAVALLSRASSGGFAIFDFSEGIRLAFNFDKGRKIALLISLIWLSLVFFIEDLDSRLEDFSKRDFMVLTSFAVATLNAMNFSANPYSVFLFYSICIVFAMFVLQKYIAVDRKQKTMFLFISSIFLELILVFIFLAVILKYSSRHEFENSLSWVFNLTSGLSFAILMVTLAIVIFNLVNPLIFMIRDKVNYHNANMFNGFILLFVFPKMLLLDYCSSQVFGIGLFANYISGATLAAIEVAIFVFLSISILAAFLIKDIKKIFLAIIFNQSLIAIMSILISSFGSGGLSIKIIVNFLLLTTLFFMVMNNVIQFLNESCQSSIKGIFGSLKLNNILLCFYFLSISGLLPPGLFISVKLLSIANENNLNSYIFFFLINSFAMILLGIKILFTAIQGSAVDKGFADGVNKIDFSSQLTLTPLAIAFIIMLTSFFI